MRLIARCIAGLPAALLLALPSGAAATHEADHPTGNYVWSTADCSSGTRRAPVTVVMRGFGTESAAMQAIDAEVPWNSPSPPINPRQYLSMDNNSSGASSCHADEAANARVSSISGSPRTLMRLWSSGYVTAATPVRQRATTASDPDACGSYVTAADGYDIGRHSFELNFQGPNTPYGPYPLQEVDWSNTQPIQLCNGTSVYSEGNVAIVRPKDDFGYNDTWDDPTIFDSNTTPNPFQRLQASGATVVRYGVSWGIVGLEPGSTPGSCNRTAGSWQRYDLIYETLTGREACTNQPTPDPPATPISPLLIAASAPGGVNGYARWCTNASGSNCTNQNCTATSNPTGTPGTPGFRLISPAVVANDVDHPTVNADWREFVHNMADRYPRAKGIEIRNEPNNVEDFWGQCPPNPTRYERLLWFAHQGIEDSTHPAIPVVLAGMKPTEDGSSQDWSTYLTNVFEAPLPGEPTVPDLFEKMGLHPYRSDEDNTTRGQNFVDAVTDDVGEARTFTSKPIWVTEVGVTTGLNDSWPTHVSSPQAQANALRNMYQELRNELRVPMVIIHRFADPVVNETPGYGVLRASNDPSPFGIKWAYKCLALTRGLTGECP